MYYAAIFIPYGEEFAVVFPDFPGAVTQAKGFKKALKYAEEALSLHLEGMDAGGYEIPKTTDYAKAVEEAKEHEGAIIVMVKPERHGIKEPPVRLTISLKPSVVAELDKAAEEMGLSRSGLITVAAKHYINTL